MLKKLRVLELFQKKEISRPVLFFGSQQNQTNCEDEKLRGCKS